MMHSAVRIFESAGLENESSPQSCRYRLYEPKRNDRATKALSRIVRSNHACLAHRNRSARRQREHPPFSRSRAVCSIAVGDERSSRPLACHATSEARPPLQRGTADGVSRREGRVSAVRTVAKGHAARVVRSGQSVRV